MRGRAEDRAGRGRETAESTLRTTVLLLLTWVAVAVADECSSSRRVVRGHQLTFQATVNGSLYLWYRTEMTNTTINVTLWLWNPSHYHNQHQQHTLHPIVISNTREYQKIGFYYNQVVQRMVVTGTDLTTRTLPSSHSFRVHSAVVRSNAVVQWISCTGPGQLALPKDSQRAECECNLLMMTVVVVVLVVVAVVASSALVYLYRKLQRTESTLANVERSPSQELHQDQRCHSRDHLAPHDVELRTYF